jgi:N-acetylglutamate synthase-like GNAT family acetyltransferase
MRGRRARKADAPAVHRLIAHYAEQGLLLPRREEEIAEHIGRFLVVVERGRLLGCVALEPYGPDLAEVRSLAVDPKIQGRGVGVRLLRLALGEARRRRIARLFAVTHAPEFFARQGFAATSRVALPEKIARDCCICPKQRTCDLVAVIAVVCPERVALPVLSAADSASAV